MPGRCADRESGGSGWTPRHGWDYASVEVSKNGGSTWTTVYGPVSGTIDSAWTRHSVALDASYAVYGFPHAVPPDMRTTRSQYRGWYVDDVSVGIRRLQPDCGRYGRGGRDRRQYGRCPGGGHSDEVSSRPRRSAITVATPDDPSQPDGVYQLFSAATGTVAINATMAGGYGTQRLNVPVIANQVVTQNFQVPAGRLSASPPSLSVEPESWRRQRPGSSP